ncbi:MAG: Eukaryotic translation initiation factor 2 alpha kinase 4 [Peltula sp. TS41687]|nr:MAG: Eukaryotic translation initiation factor 2 alpha kinase 4 [Peltula sp. TS41687]
MAVSEEPTAKNLGVNRLSTARRELANEKREIIAQHDKLKRVLRELEAQMNWQYQTLFPKLIAPLCVMMESLCLYTPVGVLAKWNPDSPQTLPIKGHGEILLPAKTVISVSANALHLNPKYWGPNSLEFRPQNWDKRCELLAYSELRDEG